MNKKSAEIKVKHATTRFVYCIAIMIFVYIHILKYILYQSEQHQSINKATYTINYRQLTFLI